jgi:hypothetical protein
MPMKLKCITQQSFIYASEMTSLRDLEIYLCQFPDATDITNLAQLLGSFPGLDRVYLGGAIKNADYSKIYITYKRLFGNRQVVFDKFW